MMRPSSILCGFAVLLSLVALASPAVATKSCPPLPVAIDNVCECKAFNYGTTPDTGVTLTIYSSTEGAVNVCGPVTLPAKRGVFCAFIFPAAENCGCQVTGEGSLTRVSLSVEFALGDSAQASVECR